MALEVVEDRPIWSVAEDDDALARLLAQQDNVICRPQALRLISPKSLRHRVTSGRWRPVYRGVLVAHNGPITDTQRLWIAVLAAGAGAPAYLGGLTALISIGLRTIQSSTVHVLLPAARKASVPTGVVVHRTRHLTDDDIGPSTQPPATMPARSVVDAVQWARTDDEARLIVASCFQQRLVDLADLDGVLARLTNARRRPLLLRTARDCAGGSESLGELDLLTLCRRGGLPLPSRQAERRDRSGRRRYLDAYFDDWRLVVEIDGAHHMNVGQMWDDSRRQNDLELAGYVVLRYPVFVVRLHPDRVIAEIRQALMAAGWTPAR
jgi:Protein of unknown function (DUF559)